MRAGRRKCVVDVPLMFQLWHDDTLRTEDVALRLKLQHRDAEDRGQASRAAASGVYAKRRDSRSTERGRGDAVAGLARTVAVGGGQGRDVSPTEGAAGRAGPAGNRRDGFCHVWSTPAAHDC